MDFDATSLYLSGIYDESSVYPKNEYGFAFKPYMNDVYIKSFNKQTCNQDGNQSAILTLNYFMPANLIFQHLPVKKR